MLASVLLPSGRADEAVGRPRITDQPRARVPGRRRIDVLGRVAGDPGGRDARARPPARRPPHRQARRPQRPNPARRDRRAARHTPPPPPPRPPPRAAAARPPPPPPPPPPPSCTRASGAQFP